ncbi:hypothetical protein ACW9YQ_15935 (plasmid) [Paraburkholderia strydomiana]
MISTPRRYEIECLTFGIVFIAVLSQLHFSTNPGSTGNVEQWLNLTNAVFYGKQDFLFSYGPLIWLTGAATSTYSLVTYWMSAIFIATVQAFFWAVLFSLSFRGRGYLLLALAYFLFFSSLLLPCAYFLWPLAIVAYLEFSQPIPIKLKGRWLVALGVIAGFSMYVRFFYGTLAAATFGSYYLSRAITERNPRELLLVAAGTVIGYIAFGLIILHQSADLINYFVINSELSFGNSVDMTMDVINTQGTFVAAGLVWLFLNIFALRRRMILFLTVNALFVLLLKLGFSRTDHYLGYFVIPAVATACIMLFDGSRQGKMLFLCTLGALYYVSVNPIYPGAVTVNSLAPGVDFSKPYQQRMAEAYAQFKLPDSVVRKIGNTAIDVYPYNNEYAFANKLNYVHRPLFQNYMTLTPKLDAMNQKFFEGANRPRFVLWTSGIACGGKDCNPFKGFDDKYALNEDPLTVSALLLNYHIVDTFAARNGIPAALLQENATHTPYVERTISSQPMRLGQWYPVLAQGSGVLKLQPHLKFTLAGRIRNLLFRGAVLNVRYRLESGDVHQFRTNILNSPSGIWVSPLLADFHLQGPRVESVMLTTTSTGYFQPEFKADWVVVPVNAVQPAQVQFDPAQPVTCDGSLDAANGQSPMPSHVEASGALKLRGWLALSAKDGIRFRRTLVSLTDSKGGRRFFETSGLDRPDVAAVYGNDAVGSSGFESQIDTAGLHGTYQIGLAGFYDDRLFVCPQFKAPVSIH